MKIRANNIDIEIEDTAEINPQDGDTYTRPVVLLIMGLGMQLVAWPAQFVQALVDASPLSNPRRVAVGMEGNRLAMLLAVLHRHGGIMTGDQDVFVNVVGGIRVQETAADLPVLLAVLSSLRNVPLADKTIAFGEVGLSGELRPVPNGEERLNEAATHGFKRAIVAKANAPKGGHYKGMEVVAVERLADALEQA